MAGRDLEQACLEWANTKFFLPDEGADDLSALDDTYFWKPVLETLVEASGLFYNFKLDDYSGVLLSGPPGNGKHTMANALMQSFLQKQESPLERLRYAELQCQDFPTGQSPEESVGRVNALFESMQQAMDNGTLERCVLILDQIEAYENAQIVLNAISDALDDNVGFSERCILICISEDVTFHNSGLFQYLLCCTCENPGIRMRRKFLQQGMNFHVPAWRDPENVGEIYIHLSVTDLSLDDLAEQTEGLSYRELSNFMFLLKTELIRQGDSDRYERNNITIKLDGEIVLDMLEALHHQMQVGGAATVVSVPQAAQVGAFSVGGAAKAPGKMRKDPDEDTGQEMINNILSMNLTGI